VVSTPWTVLPSTAGRGIRLQGYLAHKKTPPPRTLQYTYLAPYGGPRGGSFSYGRGAPVWRNCIYHRGPQGRVALPEPPSCSRNPLTLKKHRSRCALATKFVSLMPEPTPPYRCTSVQRKRSPLGPYRRPMPRVLARGVLGGSALRMGEVPL